MAKSADQLDKDPIYDKPGTAPSDPAGELKSRERAGGTSAEELERIPTMSQEERGAMDEQRGLYKSDQTPSDSLYKPVQPQKSWLGRQGLNSRNPLRRYIIFGGIGAGVISLIIVLFSFLSVFKLDGLMSNIEQRAFLRNNSSLNARSSKWLKSYVEARMMQYGDNAEKNPLFRSDRVDTNRPFTDWYRTMVTSNFERDVFEKHGIKFTSYFDENGNPRLGKIDINTPGVKDSMSLQISDADLKAISDGDLKTLSKYQDYFNMDKLDNHKDARQAIKRLVNDNTHWTQVYRRRFLRRNIQNMTGVRDWRFFENTRDKATDKKIAIRNRIIDKMVPDEGLLGEVTRCLFGLSKCSSSRDTADPKTQADVASLENAPGDNKHDPKADTPETPLNPGDLSEALQKALRSANIALQIINIPGTLDMISSVDKSLKDLVKMVVMVRGAQAAGLFQVFETSRDQIKTGQVSGEEVNLFMQNINGAASSAGWSQVISGNSASPPGTTSTGGNCSQKHQAEIQKDPEKYHDEYTPLCANQQISSASNAQKLQTAYDDSIGPIVGPIASAWSGLNSNPITGTFISVARWLGDKVNSLIGGIINGILDVLGIKGDINRVVEWVFGKVADFLGLSIYNGWETAGTIFNWLVQGGAYSAESASRQTGAALTTPATKITSQAVIAQYQRDLKQQTSLYDKVASLDNPDSLAFKGAMTLSNVQSDPGGSVMASIHGLWSGLSRNFGAIFIPKLSAAAPNGYAASQFADIETYDYPQKCYDLDPITQDPIDGTNAPEILAQHNIKVPDALYSWDTERNASKFYTAIYDAIGENTPNGDDIAVQIYNCNLLDTAVRGSLGYLYGYDADADSQVIENGDSSINAPSGDTSSGDTAQGNIYASSVNVSCDARTRDLGTQTGYRNGSPVNIRVCALPNLSSSGDESNPSSPYYIKGANGQAIVNSVYSKNFYDLVESAKSAGVTMYANSGFRTMAHQQALCQSNSLCVSGDYSLVAQPGTSNHQMGLAIDFGTQSHSQISAGDQWYTWLSTNASKFTVSNYPQEAWHWSADGH